MTFDMYVHYLVVPIEVESETVGKDEFIRL